MPLRRLLLTAAVTGAVLLVPLATAAQAHVEVDGPGAVQGGYSKLIFRVPTEKDVPTVRVEVALPSDTPIAEVRVQPKTGWTYALTRVKAPAGLTTDDGAAVTEMISRVSWTATAGGIKADEFDEFDVEAGPLPKTAQITFKVLQTYADGQVVRWIDVPVPGGAEPANPAPVLTLGAAEPAGGNSTAAKAVTVRPAALSSPAPQGSSVLAASSAALALVALLGAGYAVLQSRRARADLS